MARYRRDIDDLDDSLFTREDAARVRQERADIRAHGVEMNAALDRADAEARSKALAEILKANDDFIRREYENAGVSPPFVDAYGKPLVSLSLLLRMGWTIQDGGHIGNCLIEPPPPEKYIATGECS